MKERTPRSPGEALYYHRTANRSQGEGAGRSGVYEETTGSQGTGILRGDRSQRVEASSGHSASQWPGFVPRRGGGAGAHSVGGELERDRGTRSQSRAELRARAREAAGRGWKEGEATREPGGGQGEVPADFPLPAMTTRCRHRSAKATGMAFL